MLILYFHIFQRGFEVINAIFQALCMSPFLLPLYITICTTVRKIFRYFISI